ncbi:MAG TPA: hypothetical protein VJ842_09365 [Pyrinomonadaceae bacterium]|nr:hypothetical protein [Pyrinomonadaceae bacterium]
MREKKAKAEGGAQINKIRRIAQLKRAAQANGIPTLLTSGVPQ